MIDFWGKSSHVIGDDVVDFWGGCANSFLDFNAFKDRSTHDKTPETRVSFPGILKVAILPALLQGDNSESDLLLVLGNVLFHFLLCVGLGPEVVPPLVVFLNQRVQAFNLHAGTPVELV